jgi:hypothetical protein
MRTQNNLSRILGLVSLAGVMALAACGGGGGSKEDLEMNPDLSAPNQGSSCSMLLLCADEAGSSATAIQACLTAASTTAQASFAAIEACGIAACTVVADGGSTADGGGPACASATDTSPGCVACATGAAQSSVCASFVSACENS